MGTNFRAWAMAVARSLGPRPAEASLAAGQARSCDPIGRLKAVAPRPEDFLTKLPDYPAGELIANGDFEAGNTPTDQNTGPDGPDATAGLLPSWTFGPAVGVALNTENGTLGFGNGTTNIVSSTGDVQLGFLDDAYGPPDPGSSSIRQTFATVPGTKYRVAFEMGAIFFLNHTMEVTASVYDGDRATGAPLGQLAETRAQNDGNGYNDPTSFTFTAASTRSTLVFVETSANTKAANPAIDNVSVTALPPAPSE